MTKPDVTLTADELRSVEYLLEAAEFRGDSESLFWLHRADVLSALGKMIAAAKAAKECAT